MEHCYTIELKYYPEQIKWIISQILDKPLMGVTWSNETSLD